MFIKKGFDLQVLRLRHSNVVWSGRESKQFSLCSVLSGKLVDGVGGQGLSLKIDDGLLGLIGLLRIKVVRNEPQKYKT